MLTIDLSSLSDRDLLAETRRTADTERRATAALVSLLAEVDARRLYLGEGYSSLFAFCTRALHLSEQAAYGRIEAARAAQRFPIILTLLGDGAISLTTVGLLAPHLSDDNHEAILGSARHKSKRDVERLVAAMHPQPDIPSSVRALPVSPAGPVSVDEGLASQACSTNDSRRRREQAMLATPTRSLLVSAPSHRSVVAPIAPRRYLIRITVSEETHRKLERARDLLRHQIPGGDVVAIIDRALTVLVEHAEKTKFAATSRPSRTSQIRPAGGQAHHQSRRRPGRTRRIAAAIRRAVWARDEGCCAFVGAGRRCAETGFLEFHHVVPFAKGGPSTVDNLQLRCRTHNAHEAALEWRE